MEDHRVPSTSNVQPTSTANSLSPPFGDIGAAALLFIVLLLSFLLLFSLSLACIAAFISWKISVSFVSLTMLIVGVLYRISMMFFGRRPEQLSGVARNLGELIGKRKKAVNNIAQDSTPTENKTEARKVKRYSDH